MKSQTKPRSEVCWRRPTHADLDSGLNGGVSQRNKMHISWRSHDHGTSSHRALKLVSRNSHASNDFALSIASQNLIPDGLNERILFSNPHHQLISRILQVILLISSPEQVSRQRATAPSPTAHRTRRLSCWHCSLGRKG